MLRSRHFLTAMLGCCTLVSGFALANTDRSTSRDAQIDQRVAARLANVSPDTQTQVHVTSVNGVVTLSGYVDTSSTEQQVLSATRGTEGVTDVHNELRVKM